ncbi:MAG: hypothetical protein KKA62_04025 [Nanoarchaeota archaeon]|nr:hypothetical protein [Nanoarchaeota archaeon]MBU1643996.1 hypothetical protein [Nanoarchaeota archaeon]MBU1977091.1 hypothetical protein [Nanoarchaeota archaeon]
MTTEKTTLERKLEDFSSVHIIPERLEQLYTLVELSDGTYTKKLLVVDGFFRCRPPKLDFLPDGITATILDSGVISFWSDRSGLYARNPSDQFMGVRVELSAGKLEYRQDVKEQLEKCYGSNVRVKFDEHHPDYYDDGKRC